MLSAEDIIEAYRLEPLDQEGGFFRQVWCSPLRVENSVLGSDYPSGGTHPCGTLIHFLLTSEDFSAMHRLPTPEHWLYHMGDPAEMLLLYPDGRSETVVIGPNVMDGEVIHQVTPPHCWQGTQILPGESKHGYFFGSCLMVPGFEWSDFEMGDLEHLLNLYPDCGDAIRARVRAEPVKGEL